MKYLAGLNTTELRRLQPFLSYLLSEIESLKGASVKVDLVYGTDEDILPTANENKAGVLDKIARADHTHLFRFPTAVPTQLPPPDGASYYDTSEGIKVYVGGTATTKVVASALLSDIQPTGVKATGTAERYALADHSHNTAILPQSNTQTPVLNEIRYNSNNKLVRWNGSSWVELSVEQATPSNALPNPAGGNRSAGTSNEYSRADHTHSVVLEFLNNLSSPADRQIGVWSALDNIGNLVLAIRHQNYNRWEVPFARPLLSQTDSVPSGKGFYSSSLAELALRTQSAKQGVLYFRRSGNTVWETVGTIVNTSDKAIGIVGELLRTGATITSTGQYFLRGVDNSGNVRALPLSIRTYNQSDKPTTNLPTNAEDAYGFFIQDRRLIELYPQQSDGVERPIIIPSYQISVPVRPAFLFQLGNNTIIEDNIVGCPALTYTGSTNNTNQPYSFTTMAFLPMGIRKVRMGVFLKAGHTSGTFTYRFDFQMIGIQSNTVSYLLGGATEMSWTANANASGVVLTPIFSITLPNTYGDVWGIPFYLRFTRRWGLEQANSHSLSVVGFVVIAYRE